MDDNVLLNAILENTHEAIIVTDSLGIIIKYTKKLEEMLDLPPEDITGLPLETVMSGLDTEKEISNYETIVKHQDLIVRKTKLRMGDSFYNVYFVSGNHFNIKLANRYAEVKVLKDIYESILNSIEEGIHVADIHGKIKFINPSQRQIDGISGDVEGKHWQDIYKLNENTSLVLQSLRAEKSFYDIYQNYVTNDGKYVSVVCSSVPLYSEGRLIGAAAITKDFSKYKERAEKILDYQSSSPSPSKIRRSEGKEETQGYSFDEIIGQDKYLKDSIRWAMLGAKSDSSVLIYGETGTGKEMFAQSIHAASTRAVQPFLALNCAAIPENLLEGILFGTIKGAFTGAVDRPGLIEQARGGTLFLDEIISMPVTLQSKLLRAVEEKTIMRLGGKEKTAVDLRILSSCNVEPSKAIEAGLLRSDLFYRLAVIYIYIPPLRERLGDLEVLAQSFIDKYSALMAKNVQALSTDVMEMFRLYSWPGNIRQLMHCIEGAMNLVEPGEALIELKHIPEYLLLGFQQERNHSRLGIDTHKSLRRQAEAGLKAAGETGRRNILEEIQNQEIEEITLALQRSGGNITKAASALGMSRQRLHYRLKKYNLR